MNLKHLSVFATVILTAVACCPLQAAEKPAPSPPAKPAEAAAANPSEKKSPPPAPTPAPAAKPAGVEKIATDFERQRKERLEQQNRLIERLKGAKTDAEKEKILSEVREQQQQRAEQQREVARQIREQMQNKRGELGTASPRP